MSTDTERTERLIERLGAWVRSGSGAAGPSDLRDVAAATTELRRLLIGYHVLESTAVQALTAAEITAMYDRLDAALRGQKGDEHG